MGLTRLSALLLFVLGVAAPVSAAEKFSIFAAASMKDAIERLAASFETRCGCETTVVFAGSGTLARQIQAGAPADIFISADPRWVDWLTGQLGLDRAERADFASNRLVVISRRDLVPAIQSLAQLQSTRFAMGEPVSVPAGNYAKQALESKQLWQKVQKNAVRTENVRIALAMVENAMVDAAIVYATDAALVKQYSFWTIDANLHEPIIYTAIAVAGRSSQTLQFLTYLQSGEAKTVLEKFGFLAAGP